MNLTAIENLNRCGQVTLVHSKELPQHSEIAAVFRYEKIDIDYVVRLDQASSSS